MKTIRRRVANHILRWESAGPDQEYRVVVQNQDTGERRPVYIGFRTECRLPPDLRLTSDQLAFRVLARPVGAGDERPARIQDYLPILRLGDDYETPAPDLLTAPPIPGAGRYRLRINNPATGKPLVNMTRDEPRFLLPAGQLRDGDFRYEITTTVQGRAHGPRGVRVTTEMIAAADARAERLVPLPRPAPQTIRGAAADHAPGRADRLADDALHAGPRLLVVVDARAAPELAPVADPVDVVRRQWWAGDGSAAVEKIALALEAQGLRGQFQVDVLAGEALGDDAVGALAGGLTSRGHGVGLLVNPEPWRGLSPDLFEMDAAAVLALTLDRFQALTGRAAPAVSFADDALAPSLAAARRLGVRAILADRAGMDRLPAWMRWRTRPFAAWDDLAVIPSALLVSTPSHVRDRPVSHPFAARDAVAAAGAEGFASALAGAGGQHLVVARIDVLSLLLRRVVRSADQAEVWNQALAESLPRWAEAGWERSPRGFPVLDADDEIKTGMATGMIAALARSGVPCADLSTVFSPAALRAWCEETAAFEPLVEQRRGPRRLRRSAVRRYDAAYRQALEAPPA